MSFKQVEMQYEVLSLMLQARNMMLLTWIILSNTFFIAYKLQILLLMVIDKTYGRLKIITLQNNS